MKLEYLITDAYKKNKDSCGFFKVFLSKPRNQPFQRPKILD